MVKTLAMRARLKSKYAEFVVNGIAFAQICDDIHPASRVGLTSIALNSFDAEWHRLWFGRMVVRRPKRASQKSNSCGLPGRFLRPCAPSKPQSSIFHPQAVVHPTTPALQDSIFPFLIATQRLTEFFAPAILNSLPSILKLFFTGVTGEAPKCPMTNVQFPKKNGFGRAPPYPRLCKEATTVINVTILGLTLSRAGPLSVKVGRSLLLVVYDWRALPNHSVRFFSLFQRQILESAECPSMIVAPTGLHNNAQQAAPPYRFFDNLCQNMPK